MKSLDIPGIYIECLGSGPDLVMLHGWAMHGGLLRGLAKQLSADYRVSLIDLPGHGMSGPIDDYSLASVTDALAQAAPPTAHWLGWSLGGLLALEFANTHAERVRSLVMISGTPRFTAETDWPGVDPALLQQMSVNLAQDFFGTLKRFIGLQTFNQENPRTLAKQIHDVLDERPMPDKCALRGGLALLQDIDARPVLARLQKQVLAIMGAKDRLVPMAQTPRLLELTSRVEVQVLTKAAHLPFLTHPQETACLIREFLSLQDRV
jgi:pimeloyl-[acyl-carrier protein] methyl ester esterase